MYLTARSSERGMTAVADLMKEGCTVHFHQLDIDDGTSIERIRDENRWNWKSVIYRKGAGPEP